MTTDCKPSSNLPAFGSITCALVNTRPAGAGDTQGLRTSFGSLSGHAPLGSVFRTLTRLGGYAQRGASLGRAGEGLVLDGVPVCGGMVTVCVSRRSVDEGHDCARRFEQLRVLASGAQEGRVSLLGAVHGNPLIRPPSSVGSPLRKMKLYADPLKVGRIGQRPEKLRRIGIKWRTAVGLCLLPHCWAKSGQLVGERAPSPLRRNLTISTPARISRALRMAPHLRVRLASYLTPLLSFSP